MNAFDTWFSLAAAALSSTRRMINPTMISFSAVEIRRIHRTIVQFLRRRRDKNTPVLFDVPGASLSRHSKSFALVVVGSLVVDHCTVA